MKIKNLIEGLNAQQRSVPQLPAQAKAKHISVLGAKTDPQHPFAGYMVGADESVEPGKKSIGPDQNDPYEKGWRARPDAANPYAAGTPEHAEWQNGRDEREAQPNHYDESVSEDKHQPLWTVEQRTAGHHNAFYIVKGHSKPREVWKNARGMSDFKNKSAAEAKAEELNSQQVNEAGGSFMAAGHYNNMIFQQNLNNLGQQLSRLSPEDLEHFNQIAMGIGIGSAAGVAGVIGGYVLSDKFMSLMRRTMSAAKNKAHTDTEDIIKLQRQIVSIHKMLKRVKTEPAIAKYQAMLKQAYEVLEELEARQGNRVAEGKPQKRADRYHINKDGKPASLASYADKSSAVKDRDARYPDAKVHQVGPRGKVKGEFEEGVAEGKWNYPPEYTKKANADDEAELGVSLINKDARKAWRKKQKAKAHKDLMTGKKKETSLSEEFDSDNNPWRVTDVDPMSETDFEVALQGPGGQQLNFVIRPVDFMETRFQRYQIDTMDVRDLQTGKTMHWGSMNDLGQWEPIFDAIDTHFWESPALQARLEKIISYYMDAGEQGKNPDMMPGLDQRDPNGVAVSADDFIASHDKTQDAMSKMKKGVAENWGEPLTGWHVVYARTGNKVSGTPDFNSRESAQKYLMTKMSANHHNYRIAHSDQLGTSAPTPMGGYLESKGRNELDTPAVQAALAKMAERHRGEKWSKEQLAALGKRIAARGQKPVKEDDVADFLARGGKITQVKPNRGPRNPGLSLGSRHIGGGGDGARASRTGRGSKPQGKPVVAVETDVDEGWKSKLAGAALAGAAAFGGGGAQAQTTAPTGVNATGTNAAVVQSLVNPVAQQRFAKMHADTTAKLTDPRYTHNPDALAQHQAAPQQQHAEMLQNIKNIEQWDNPYRIIQMAMNMAGVTPQEVLQNLPKGYKLPTTEPKGTFVPKDLSKLNVKEDVTKEDIITKLKAKLGDYLSDLGQQIKKDPALQDKLSAKTPGDQMGPPVKTITTDDGHQIQIHGNEDDGFRISIKNRQTPSQFSNLDEAVMACEMYCARRRTQALNADYVEEA